MNAVRWAIVGGGLSGLYAAYLLEQVQGVEYTVFEARDDWGGRIQSARVSPVCESSEAFGADLPGDRFDLGPTWYWPSMQPTVERLVHTLGLKSFEQFEAGDLLFEQTLTESPARLPGMVASPPSSRILGGMSEFIDALRAKLPAARLRLKHSVTSIRVADTGVEVWADSETCAGESMTFDAVLLAVPPRLAVDTIGFSPALPESVGRSWRATPTWMAPHAKYLAVYDRPFWRDRGLSGEARSARGPMGEIHDASYPNGPAALFGFLKTPAVVRRTIPEATLKELCRTQLVRLFGADAASPRQDFLKDWAVDRHTATAQDQDGSGHHGPVPPSSVPSGAWSHRIKGIASEWSPESPGYVAGALDAAHRGVQAMLLERRSLPA